MDCDSRSRASRRKPIKTHRVSVDTSSADADSELCDDVSGVVSQSESAVQSDASNAEFSESGTCEDDGSTRDSNATPTNIILPEGTVVVQPEAVEDYSFDGPEFSGVNTSTSAARTSVAHCTGCNQRIDATKSDTIFRHPVLKVLLCKRCHEYHHHKMRTGMSTSLKQCLWCAAGIDLICCDFCPAKFCRMCIRRNLGNDVLEDLLGPETDQKWRCFVCNPKPLSHLVNSVSQLITVIDSMAESAKLNAVRALSSETRRTANNGSKSIGPSVRPSAAMFSSLADTDAENLLAGCGLSVNEYNVWQVAEKLLAATQSMSMLLGSLNDDLRRTGAFASNVEPQSVRKRSEIATKLWRAFVAYRKSFTDIEEYTRSANGGGTKSSPATAMQRSFASSYQPRQRTVPQHQQQQQSAHRNLPSSRPPPQPTEIIELSDSDDDDDGRSGSSSSSSSRLDGSGRESSVQPPVKKRCVASSSSPGLEISATNIENGSKRQEGLDMTVSDYSNGSSRDEAEEQSVSSQDSKLGGVTAASDGGNSV